MAKRARKSTQKRSRTGSSKREGSTAKRRSKTPARRAKRVYLFGNGRAEGRAAMRNLLGGKGANLAEMTRLGIPVPPGFTISTEVCLEFYRRGRKLPPGLREEVLKALAQVETWMKARFGNWMLLSPTAPVSLGWLTKSF